MVMYAWSYIGLSQEAVVKVECLQKQKKKVGVQSLGLPSLTWPSLYDLSDMPRKASSGRSRERPDKARYGVDDF
jgi:hypothetical protein